MALILSVGSVIGFFVTWKKSGADTISTLQKTVNDLVDKNSALITRISELETKFYNCSKIIEDLIEGGIILYNQVLDNNDTPKWTPPPFRDKDDENYISKDHKWF